MAFGIGPEQKQSWGNSQLGNSLVSTEDKRIGLGKRRFEKRPKCD